MSDEGRCAHCGRPLDGFAGSASVLGTKVCHPRIPDGPDCFRLITVYDEEIGVRKTGTADRDACLAELEAYQERAEAKIRELARERLDLLDRVSEAEEYHRRGTEPLRAELEQTKRRLRDVVNEVFTIAEAFSRPMKPERDAERTYAIGRHEGLQHARFAVLRGLGVFDPSHTVYVPVPRLEDTDLIRQAINDPGAFVRRGRINEVEDESLGNWAARAVQAALKDEEEL